MPLGQRIAHMRPEGCLSIFDLFREAFVDASDRHLEVVGRVPEAVASVIEIRAAVGLVVAFWSSTGSHSIRIRNVGTATRPRIDWDAVVILRKL
jgi:hypothetical protein